MRVLQTCFVSQYRACRQRNIAEETTTGEELILSLLCLVKWTVSYLLSSICCDYAYRSAYISNTSSPIQKSPISHGIGDVLKSWGSPYDDDDDDDGDDDDDDDGGDDGDCDDDGSDCNDDDCDDDDDDYDVPHIQSQSQLV